ncbi:MAG: hypothetical protein GWN00_18225 [Aliifodinibius sp.]|nr:hypothetical protein [Fodinibius sp.]NIV12999.1 hypothetical protein [Fodinibius sp.]NIY26670.1 hypothetical protein [Fodinibius sp.]
MGYYDVAGLSFDGNGNILSLSRNNEAGGPIDVLSYSYTAGSNRLASVSDAVAPTSEDWDAGENLYLRLRDYQKPVYGKRT